MFVSREEAPLYRAARDLGFIEMEEQASLEDRAGAESVWRITLTERGKEESAKCRPQSSGYQWGIPVARRQFISGTKVGNNPAAILTIFDVEYSWLPIDAGNMVSHVLTDDPIPQGTLRAKVHMRKGPNVVQPGPNGWIVTQIAERK